MKLLRHQDIGIMIIAELSATDKDRTVSLSVIAKKHGVSVFYLKKIARALKLGGLIASREGFGGGYFLSRPASEISVWDVIVAVDSGISLREYENHSRDACPLNKTCLPRTIRNHVAEALKKTLVGMTISTLLREG